MLKVTLGALTWCFSDSFQLSHVHSFLQSYFNTSYSLKTIAGNTAHSLTSPHTHLFVHFPLLGGFGRRNLEQIFKDQAKDCTSLPSLYSRDAEGRRIIEVPESFIKQLEQEEEKKDDDEKTKKDVVTESNELKSSVVHKEYMTNLNKSKRLSSTLDISLAVAESKKVKVDLSRDDLFDCLSDCSSEDEICS
ncbi:hypothetical protein RCL1_008635 [Eukaryota sp. TZLM3-RCL]